MLVADAREDEVLALVVQFDDGSADLESGFVFELFDVGQIEHDDPHMLGNAFEPCDEVGQTLQLCCFFGAVFAYGNAVLHVVGEVVDAQGVGEVEACFRDRIALNPGAETLVTTMRALFEEMCARWALPFPAEELDDGARDLVLRLFQSEIEALAGSPEERNPKGELQEMLQAKSTEAPRYEMTATSGPDHNRQFECAVFHLGAELGRGQGKSKKEAEGQAAISALLKLRAQPTTTGAE